MGAYRAFGRVVASRVVLRGLPRVTSARPDCVFELRREPIRARPTGPRRALGPPGDRRGLTVNRAGARYLLRFRALADFLVSRDGREVIGAPRRGVSADVVRHLFLAQVMPLALSRRGWLVVHASAVVTPHGAVAFLGAAGRGKSTLGASFVRGGFPLLADDGLLLMERGRALVAVPSYPEIRLWPDALAVLDGARRQARDVARRTGKQRLAVGGPRWPFSRAQAPLRRMYVLGAGRRNSRTSAVTITPLRDREAFVELVKHVFRLDVDDRTRLRAEFAAIARLVSRIALYRLAFPRDLSRLPAVQAATLGHLEQ